MIFDLETDRSTGRIEDMFIKKFFYPPGAGPVGGSVPSILSNRGTSVRFYKDRSSDDVIRFTNERTTLSRNRLCGSKHVKCASLPPHTYC